MMEPPPTATLATLPDEIVQATCQYLDAKTVLALSATARRFTRLANEPLLWKQFCVNDFRYWNSRRAHRQQLRDISSRDWKAVYAERFRTACKARTTLDAIVADSRARSDRIKEIVDGGYRVKDALLQAFRDASTSPDHLAQRYWSHVALGCLHRTVALEEWTRIKYRVDVADPTERALAAFDMFVLDQREQGDIDDVFDRLESYVAEVREAYPDIDDQTPRTKAMTIAAYMRDRGWVGIDPGREYHSLDNMFIGVALFSTHHNSLPLITSVIYSYVARQFGLRAQPISYPMHVHVLVQPPEGVDVDGKPLGPDFNPMDGEPNPRTHLYMDPFHSIEPVPLSTLRTSLRFITSGASRAQTNSYLSAATHRDLLIRAAHNILNTRTTDARLLDHPVSPESATYAAFFALVLFPTHPASLRTHLTELTQHFLHHYDQDIHVFRTYILPLTTSLPDHLAYRNLSLQLLHNDLEVAIPKPRSLDPATRAVQYKVGQLFRHRRRDYLALIYGWDATCEMTQQWISMNQVDRLPRGRGQPFYNVLVIDDRSTRYVAEENVVLLGPEDQGGNGETASAADVDAWPIEIGKWMKRFDVGPDGRGWRFVSNLRDQYPED